eukprot:1410374-Rhodomonas_salina.1
MPGAKCTAECAFFAIDFGSCCSGKRCGLPIEAATHTISPVLSRRYAPTRISYVNASTVVAVYAYAYLLRQCQYCRCCIRLRVSPTPMPVLSLLYTPTHISYVNASTVVAVYAYAYLLRQCQYCRVYMCLLTYVRTALPGAGASVQPPTSLPADLKLQ